LGASELLLRAGRLVNSATVLQWMMLQLPSSHNDQFCNDWSNLATILWKMLQLPLLHGDIFLVGVNVEFSV
jgi:hypothetical protein